MRIERKVCMITNDLVHFLDLFFKLCVCVGIYAPVHSTNRARAHVRSLEAGVTGACEQPDLGAGNGIPVLCKSSRHFRQQRHFFSPSMYILVVFLCNGHMEAEFLNEVIFTATFKKEKKKEKDVIRHKSKPILKCQLKISEAINNLRDIFTKKQCKTNKQKTKANQKTLSPKQIYR